MRNFSKEVAAADVVINEAGKVTKTREGLNVISFCGEGSRGVRAARINLVGVALDQLGNAQELLQGAEDDCAVALEFVDSAVAWLEEHLEAHPGETNVVAPEERPEEKPERKEIPGVREDLESLEASLLILLQRGALREEDMTTGIFAMRYVWNLWTRLFGGAEQMKSIRRTAHFCSSEEMEEAAERIERDEAVWNGE